MTRDEALRILGLASTANPNDIKKAYRNLSKLHIRIEIVPPVHNNALYLYKPHMRYYPIHTNNLGTNKNRRDANAPRGSGLSGNDKNGKTEKE